MDENSRLAREWAEDRDKSLRIEVEQAKRLEKALKQAEAGGIAYDFPSPPELATLQKPQACPNNY